MDTLKRIEKIIREKAFDENKKKPGLKFNPRLAVTGVRTTGPWMVSYSIASKVAPLVFASINLYETSEAKAAFYAKRERRGEEKIELYFSPPLVSQFALVLRFPQNATFASLTHKAPVYAGYTSI